MKFERLAEMRAVLADTVGDIDPDSPRGKKRLRLIDAATGLFVAHGYRKTSIDDIARAAGVAKGTVYLYFATKPDILLAACAREKLRLFAVLDGFEDPGLDARERLRRWVRASILMVAASPLLTRVAAGDPDMLGAMLEVMPERVGQALARANDFLDHLLDAAVAPAQWTDEQRHARVVVLQSLSRLAPLVHDAPLRQGLSIEQFAETLADVFVDGTRVPERAHT